MIDRELLRRAAEGKSFDSAETIRVVAAHSLLLEGMLRRVHPGLFETDMQSAGAQASTDGQEIRDIGEVREWVLAEILQMVIGRVVEALQAVGLWDYDALCNASEDELLAVDGVGPATLKTVRSVLKEAGNARTS